MVSAPGICQLDPKTVDPSTIVKGIQLKHRVTSHQYLNQLCVVTPSRISPIISPRSGAHLPIPRSSTEKSTGPKPDVHNPAVANHCGLKRTIDNLKKHGPRSLSGYGIWRADLYNVVTKEHHFEEEGDDHVEEDDWDDEYPANARVCLKK